MEWYQVTKTIRGRKYLYWQKTYRVGSSVKTLNKYIGPGANGPRMPSLKSVMANKSDEHKSLRKQYDAGKISKPEYLTSVAALPGSGAMREWKTTSSGTIDIPSYKQAYALIAKEGGFANVSSLHGENAYAAEQFAQSAALNRDYIFAEATKRNIRINEYLLRFDAETDASQRFRIATEFVTAITTTQHDRTVSEHRAHMDRADIQPNPPRLVYEEPQARRENYTADEWREHLRAQSQRRREYEAGMKIETAKLRAVKRKTKGIKAANPYLAILLKK